MPLAAPPPAAACATTESGGAGQPAAVTVGIASLGVHVTRFLRAPPAGDTGAAPAIAKRRGVCTPHAATLRAIAAFAAARGLDVLLVMSRRRGKRKLAVLRCDGGVDASAYAAVLDVLAHAPELELEAIPVEWSPEGGGLGVPPESVSLGAHGAASLRVFRQRNALSSRKQVAPLVVAVVAKVLEEQGRSPQRSTPST